MKLPTTLTIAMLLALSSAPCVAQSVNGAAVSAAQGVDAGERSRPRQVKPPVETVRKPVPAESVPHAPLQQK